MELPRCWAAFNDLAEQSWPESRTRNCLVRPTNTTPRPSSDGTSLTESFLTKKFESATRAFAERLASGATLSYAAGKKIVRAYLEKGIRTADALVGEVAPALFETADMRAGVDGLIEHGPRQFRNKVIFEESLVILMTTYQDLRQSRIAIDWRRDRT